VVFLSEYHFFDLVVRFKKLLTGKKSYTMVNPYTFKKRETFGGYGRIMVYFL